MFFHQIKYVNNPNPYGIVYIYGTINCWRHNYNTDIDWSDPYGFKATQTDV